MLTVPLPPPSSARYTEHDQLRRLFWLRCVAILGQLGVIAVAQTVLGVRLPLVMLAIPICLLALFNGLTWWRQMRADAIHPTELFGQLLVDLTALSALLYCTGGATNPFVSFYLPLLAVAAAILPGIQLLLLSVFALFCYTALVVEYMPLDLVEPGNAVTYHLAGMWVNFVISAGLISVFVARITQALREREAALAQAQAQLLRDERIVALGAQAAGIAHDIGTPLATVAVITGELRHEARHLPALQAFDADLLTMETQLAQIKQALRQLQEQAPADTRMALGEWLPTFAENWRLRHPHASLTLSWEHSAQPQPHDGMTDTMMDSVQIGQMLTVLLDNAARAHAQAGVTTPITLQVSKKEGWFCLRISDQGAGLPPALRHQLGENPVASPHGGQGLGLYLTSTSVQRLGGSLHLSDATPNGTIAELRLPCNPSAPH